MVNVLKRKDSSDIEDLQCCEEGIRLGTVLNLSEAKFYFAIIFIPSPEGGLYQTNFFQAPV